MFDIEIQSIDPMNMQAITILSKYTGWGIPEAKEFAEGVAKGAASFILQIQAEDVQKFITECGEAGTVTRFIGKSSIVDDNQSVKMAESVPDDKRKNKLFCHMCGTQISEGAAFCHKCGVKVASMGAVQQAPIESQENLGSGNTNTLMSEKSAEARLASVKMLIGIDKVAGKAYSKFSFSVFVDGILMGDLANGQTAAYMISTGQHLVKIGGFIIGINVPTGDTSVELDFHWGESAKPEIVCHQSQWVSKPCEREKVSARAVLKSMNTGIKAGIACILIGVVGVIIGGIIMPSSSGGIVSAEGHSAALAQMDIAFPLFIGGLSLWVIGALIIILASRKKK